MGRSPTARSIRSRTCPKAGPTSRRPAATAPCGPGPRPCYTVGPTGIKRWLFPPRQTLWEARIAEGGFTIVDQAAAVPRCYAFLGVRSCDLHAVAVQDRVFRQPGFTDTGYAARRDAAFF